jgi:hypothetical protein
MAINSTPLTRAWLWPPVGTRRQAAFAIQEAFWASLFVAAVTLIFAVIGILRDSREGTDFSLFIDPLLFGLAAFGIRMKSRTAAVAGFSIYIASRLYLWIAIRPSNLILSGLIALVLFHGIRGTYAFHKFPPIPKDTPSIEKSFQSMKADSVTEDSAKDAK